MPSRVGEIIETLEFRADLYSCLPWTTEYNDAATVCLLSGSYASSLLAVPGHFHMAFAVLC